MGDNHVKEEKKFPPPPPGFITCEECVFCVADEKKPEQGYCRQGPPTPIMYYEPNPLNPREVRTMVKGQYPPVEKKGWCGQGEPREALPSRQEIGEDNPSSMDAARKEGH